MRVFHWSLVGSVTIALTTGFVMGASWITLHIIGGSVAAALMIARIVWGFTGSHFARFSEFVRGPGHIIDHIKELKSNTAPRHLGHNPLGAAMVLILIVTVLGLSVSGLVVLGGTLKFGPLAGLAFSTGALFQELHEAGAILLLLLIIAHVGGVVFESMRSDENLVKSMVTGDKDIFDGDTSNTTAKATAKPLIAIVLMGAIFAPIAYWVTQDKSAMIQHPPVLVSAFPDSYATECADCHKAYHPSLLPAVSWVKLTQGLENHFGEDASLDDETVAEIAAWLQTASAETADTKPANMFRIVDAKNPIAISETPFWREIHHEVGEGGTFERAPIYNKSNCFACHQDAAQGWFNPSKVQIPARQK